jgi:hypothetical protein
VVLVATVEGEMERLEEYLEASQAVLEATSW